MDTLSSSSSPNINRFKQTRFDLEQKLKEAYKDINVRDDINRQIRIQHQDSLRQLTEDFSKELANIKKQQKIKQTSRNRP